MKIPRGVLPGAALSGVLIAGLWSVRLRCQPAAHGLPGAQTASAASSNAQAAQAQRALAAGDYQQAISLYQELVKKAPGVAEIHSNLAVAYYFSGQLADAARESRLALKINPALLNAHYFLDMSLAEGGYCREAAPYLEKDFARVKDSRLKRTIGADALRCAMSLNNVNQMFSYYQILAREFPSDPEVLYLSAHMFSDLSTQASQHLLAAAPNSYQAYRMNAEVLELQGKPQDAVAEYRKVLKLDPHLPGIHYEIGSVLLQQSHDPETLEQARKEFEAELEVAPGNAQAELQLGRIAGTLRKWDDAITHLEKATKLDPEMEPALVNLGEAYVAAGRVQEAIAPLKRATELDPQNADAHYRLSFVYRRMGRNQEAEQQLAAYKKAYDQLLKAKQRIRAGVGGGSSDSDSNTPRR